MHYIGNRVPYRMHLVSVCMPTTFLPLAFWGHTDYKQRGQVEPTALWAGGDFMTKLPGRCDVVKTCCITEPLQVRCWQRKAFYYTARIFLIPLHLGGSFFHSGLNQSWPGVLGLCGGTWVPFNNKAVFCIDRGLLYDARDADAGSLRLCRCR